MQGRWQGIGKSLFGCETDSWFWAPQGGVLIGQLWVLGIEDSLGRGPSYGLRIRGGELIWLSEGSVGKDKFGVLRRWFVEIR